MGWWSRTNLDPDTESVKVFGIRRVRWHVTTWFNRNDISRHERLASELEKAISQSRTSTMSELTDCFDRRSDSHEGHFQGDAICNGDTEW